MQDSTYTLSSHSFANLPGELILEVFQYLSVKELCICAQEQNSIWRKLYQIAARKSISFVTWNIPNSTFLDDSKSLADMNKTSHHQGNFFPPPKIYLQYSFYQDQLRESTKGHAKQTDQRSWKGIYASKKNWVTGKCNVKTLSGHSNQVRCLQFDHSKVISGSLDQTIKIWNMNTGECTDTIDTQGKQVLCLQYDQEKIVNGSGDSTIKIWDLETKQRIRTLEGHKDVVMCLQFDKSKIISGGDDKSLRIWDARSHQSIQTLPKAHSNLITCLQFDDTKLISGCWSGELSVWDLRVVRLPGIETDGTGMGNITCLQFDHEKLVCGSTHHASLQVWSMQTHKRLKGFSLYYGVGVTCLQFDDSKVVTGFRGKELVVWDLESKKNRYVLPGHTDTVSCLMFDESKIVTGSKDKTIKIWDFTSKTSLSKEA